MRSNLLPYSLLSLLILALALSLAFAAPPGETGRDRFTQMIHEGWKPVAPGVLQRSLGSHSTETFAMGREGFSWLAEQLQARLAALKDEYQARPTEALLKEIKDLEKDARKLQDQSQSLPSYESLTLACAVTYTVNATAFPTPSAQGARADANASFSSGCASTADTYAYAYARATQNATTTTVTQTNPNSGSTASSLATASASGNTDCYSYATSRVISFDEGISDTVAAENFDCTGISINDVSLTEGNSGTKAFNFTISLSSVSSSTVTVTAQTANGTATAPSDYAAAGPTTVTFNPGEVSKSFTVLVNGDNVYELNETFYVNLSAPTGAMITDNQGVGTITADDPLPSITITDPYQNEGNSGTIPMNFNVSLSNPSSFNVSVNYQTANGTATAGSDYVAVPSTVLTFAPLETSKTITITIIGDTTEEPTETFSVKLSGASGGTIGKALGTGIILNDDAPVIVITDMTVDEGSATDPSYTVTLSPAPTQTVSVTVSSANGLALSTVDYGEVGPLTLTFAPGVASQSFTLRLRRDNLPELAEPYFLNFRNPVNGILSKTQAKITINDDDAVTWNLYGDANNTSIPGCIALSQVGDGRGAAYNFKTVPLSEKFDMIFRVGFGIYDAPGYKDGGGGMVFTLRKEGSFILGGADMGYESITPSVGVEMDTLANWRNDPAEDHMTVDENGVVSNSALGYSVQASATSANIEDGYEHTFRVTRDPSTLQLRAYFDDSLRLTYTKDILNTVYGGTNATYFGMTGATSCNNSPTCPDNVHYFCPVAICIGNTATPQVIGDDVTVSEGNSGNQTATFKINLYCPRNETVTVSYATADGTATAGSDYLATSGTLTFAPGETQKTVAVTVYPDATSEPDETFYLNLSSPSVNLATPDTQVAATIIDDMSVGFGQAGDIPLVGDWNGDGIDTPGVFRNGVVYLRNSNTAGPADITYTFGPAGTKVIVGDWDGDGIDTLGVVQGDTFYLRATNAASSTFTTQVAVGLLATDTPIAGDWNGDGIDTVAVYRPSMRAFYIDGAVVWYGLVGDVPVIGDWNNDGIDTVGVFRNGTFFLRNSNTTGVEDLSLTYGAFQDLPLAGDMDGDGDDTVGYFRSGTFVLRK